MVVQVTNRNKAPLLFFHMTGDATLEASREHLKQTLADGLNAMTLLAMAARADSGALIRVCDIL